MSASLNEIETQWSITDVWDANQAIDILEDLEVLSERAS
jgi:hypothetical protein